MAQSSADHGAQGRRLAWAALAVAGALAVPAVLAQNYPVTPSQRSTAEQVAQAGVPVSELADNAPDSYTIKRGDTLWGISGMFLKSPWRWPELWGMNMDEVRNPHRIYPGQQLVLEKSNGRATLRVKGSGSPDTPPSETIRVSPRTRYEGLGDSSLPTLKPHLIEPFLAEPVILEEGVLERAPRIVAAPDSRVLLTRGDRAYARGGDVPLKRVRATGAEEYRVYRNAKVIRDPKTKAVLGYEAQYLGRAELVRNETAAGAEQSDYDDVRFRDGYADTYVLKGSDPKAAAPRELAIPATIDIIAAKEEMRAGDRLLPEPPRQLVSYVPRAPEGRIDGAIVSMYGEAVGMAAQNQVVVINKGTADGLVSGNVLAILKDGNVVRDRTQGGLGTPIKLPDERNGLMMVFRTFEKLSYALILEITDGVEIGDRVVNPR